MVSKNRLWPCEGRRPKSDPAGGGFLDTIHFYIPHQNANIQSEVSKHLY